LPKRFIDLRDENDRLVEFLIVARVIAAHKPEIPRILETGNQAAKATHELLLVWRPDMIGQTRD
jgi:hypothetical protein